MAIQLNDRDQLIFKLIEEHHVLLEKHIAWFISKDSKPVLIRDRLRKLFYLDYLLCGRHAEILPWWTTPTKPLVYMLSALARHTISGVEPTCDLNDNRVQRHFLEIANLRMLLLIAQKDGLISSVEWTTTLCINTNNGNADKSADTHNSPVNAKVSFTAGGEQKQVGIVNSPTVAGDKLIPQLEAALKEPGVRQLWITCQDDIHQALLQEIVAAVPALSECVLFATHPNLYNLGITKSQWQTADRRRISIVVDTTADTVSSLINNVVPVPIVFPHAATA